MRPQSIENLRQGKRMYDEILKSIAKYPVSEQEVLSKAFYYAKKAHEGQKRASGEEYFTHPVAVAQILIDLGMDYHSVAASFLHDVIEDTPVSEGDIKEEFGEEIPVVPVHVHAVLRRHAIDVAAQCR